MAIRLPRPPAHQDPNQWGMWFDAVYKALSGIVGIVWGAIDKTGSRLSDIETRPHSDLQNILPADDTSTDTTANRHISDAMANAWTAKLDTVAVDGVTITGDGTTGNPLALGDVVYALEVDDAGSNIIYIGEAAPGSALSAAVWRIQHVDTSGGDCAITWADGNDNFDNVWNDRLTLVYS